MKKKLITSDHKLTCPHCGNFINKEWLLICRTEEDVKYIYICSDCSEIIGIFNDNRSILFAEQSHKTKARQTVSI